MNINLLHVFILIQAVERSQKYMMRKQLCSRMRRCAVGDRSAGAEVISSS